MNISITKNIYFIGIGGIGMSALARYFHQNNKIVGGYDSNSSDITDSLIDEGINIHFDNDFFPEWITNAPKETSLIIYTPAVRNDDAQLLFFRKRGYNIYKRADVLGFITENTYTIAVSGTHGKTTTTALLSHILNYASIKSTSFLGGISNNYNTNFLCSDESDIIIVEADEYDKSFLKLEPDIIIITSIDADHMDIYKDIENLHQTFKDFSNKIKQNGILLVNKHINVEFPISDSIKMLTYSADIKSDIMAYNLNINEDEIQSFDAKILDILPGEIHQAFIDSVQLKLPGKHNVENAIAAMSVAYYLGATINQIIKAVSSFSGVKRRFDKYQYGKYIYIDDYAHHPKEIEVTLKAIQKLYPNKKMSVIFQPHLYSRTLNLADDFASALSIADEIMLLDIYPAREKQIKGVNSEFLAKKIKVSQKSIETKKTVLNKIQNQKRDLLVTLGAGDIDELVNPIKEIYS